MLNSEVFLADRTNRGRVYATVLLRPSVVCQFCSVCLATAYIIRTIYAVV